MNELAPSLSALNFDKIYEEMVNTSLWDVEAASRTVGEGSVPIALGQKKFEKGPRICGSIKDKGEDDEDHYGEGSGDDS